MRVRVRRDDAGFTLPELLVAMTILGIIMGAIGAMIATSFRTSSTVSARLNASRGPKMMARYWVPDAEQAREVRVGEGGCGTDAPPVVTFVSDVAPSAFESPDPEAPGGARLVTWSERMLGERRQLVRSACVDGAPVETLPVVADLADGPDAVRVGAVVPGQPVTITVTVPERGAAGDVYTFSVSGAPQVTPPEVP